MEPSTKSLSKEEFLKLPSKEQDDYINQKMKDLAKLYLESFMRISDDRKSDVFQKMEQEAGLTKKGGTRKSRRAPRKKGKTTRKQRSN